MKDDLSKYSSERRNAVRNAYTVQKGDVDVKHFISMFAHASMCPAIVVALWIGDIDNWSEPLLENIHNLVKYYGYTEIKNAPPQFVI